MSSTEKDNRQLVVTLNRVETALRKIKRVLAARQRLKKAPAQIYAELQYLAALAGQLDTVRLELSQLQQDTEKGYQSLSTTQQERLDLALSNLTNNDSFLKLSVEEAMVSDQDLDLSTFFYSVGAAIFTFVVLTNFTEIYPWIFIQIQNLVVFLELHQNLFSLLSFLGVIALPGMAGVITYLAQRRFQQSPAKVTALYNLFSQLDMQAKLEILEEAILKISQQDHEKSNIIARLTQQEESDDQRTNNDYPEAGSDLLQAR